MTPASGPAFRRSFARSPWRRSRSSGLGHPTRSRPACCSWPPGRPATSRGRSSRWTEGCSVSRSTEEILTLLPHRPPFLFLDEILERDNQHIKATKTLHPDEPYLAGHYPGRPLMPGVLICECVFQAGAALLFGRGGLAPQRGPGLTQSPDAPLPRPRLS